MTTRHPSASPTRIRFGSRPMIAAGFVKRQGQDELFEAVFARAEPRTVLTGMRGSGKTQLAAAVAARCEEEGWPLVAWIHAASRKHIIADLYELALRIGIDAPKNIPLEVIVQRLLAQLRSAEAADRLFVFDNVENPDDLRDLIPEGTGVRTLITTTHHLDWDGPGWLRLTVGAFEREQSIALLCKRTGDTHREAADRIADTARDDEGRKREGLDHVLAGLSDPTEIKRVRHVITEIWRVRDFAGAFGSGDIRTAGSLFNASHDSLRYDYEVTVPELDTAVEVARSNGAYGARMTGGGFGGSIIALVHKGQSRQLAEKIAEAFSAKGFRQPQALTSVASRAAERVA